MDENHYTVWIITDRAYLDSDLCTITVQRDELAEDYFFTERYRDYLEGGEQERVTLAVDWTPVGDPVLEVTTSVRYDDVQVGAKLDAEIRATLAEEGLFLVGEGDVCDFGGWHTAERRF